MEKDALQQPNQSNPTKQSKSQQNQGKNKEKKQNKIVEPKITNVEIYQRLNYLHQASMLMSVLPLDSNKQNGPEKQKKLKKPRNNPSKKQLKRRRVKEQLYSNISSPKRSTLSSLGSFYASTMKKCAQKLVLKLDPSVKRQICKYCNTCLIPGITSQHEISDEQVEVICQECGTKKRWLNDETKSARFDVPE